MDWVRFWSQMRTLLLLLLIAVPLPLYEPTVPEHPLDLNGKWVDEYMGTITIVHDLETGRIDFTKTDMQWWEAIGGFNGKKAIMSFHWPDKDYGTQIGVLEYRGGELIGWRAYRTDIDQNWKPKTKSPIHLTRKRP